MNTNGAIEFIEYIITIAGERYNEDNIKKKDKVIGLLKCGDRYKKIIDDLEDDPITKYKIIIPNEYLAIKGGMVKYLIKILKEKYSPKPQVWKQFFGVDFADGESIMVKFTVTKEPNGNIIIAPVITESEKGGET